MLDFDFEPETPAWSKRLAAFDLETTGLDLKTARVVTACVVVIDQAGEPEQLHEWLINPGIEIPEPAAAVHGVTTEIAVRDGVEPSGAIREITELLERLSIDMPLVAFNAPYDFTILANEAIRYGQSPIEPKPVVDPLVLDKKADQYRKGKRNLGVMAQHYGVELTDAHNSTADAIAAGRIAQKLAKKFAELDMPIAELHDAQAKWSDEQTEGFAKYMKTQNRPDFQAVLGWPKKI
ncbi:MAG: exonuclease domain-containing protein [Aquiluna sp.]|nr:exonuclease domain-containing protein [Aquiluna sp.]